MTRRLPLAALALAIGLRAPLPAAPLEFRSQASAWFSLNDDSPATPRLGLRWQPGLSLGQELGKKWKLDGEFSLDLRASASAPGWRHPALDAEAKPYRLWLRLSSPRFEARLGLQKINFGSAMVFRPLMWFDRIDARDPLQLTDGVYGLLLRYYFRSNANLWLWGLYGNDDPKGWETLATAAHAPEFGGRIQSPLFSGEAAATVHFRRAAGGDAESRFALDGKWDVGVGLWVEAALVHRRDPLSGLAWGRSAVLGIDYTFGLGHGLYLLGEHFFAGSSANLLGAGGMASLSALLARYPLGLLDSLSAVLYYDWHNRQAYSFADWQHTLDRWQFHAMAFANPRQPRLAGASSPSAVYSGLGFQLLAVWNI